MPAMIRSMRPSIVPPGRRYRIDSCGRSLPGQVRRPLNRMVPTIAKAARAAIVMSDRSA